MTHSNLKFQGKEVIDIPQKKAAYVKVTTYESSGIFENKCVLPDNTSDIYAMTGEGTFFKDIGIPNVIQSSQNYHGRGLEFIGLGEYSTAGYWFSYNDLRSNRSKIMVGKNKKDMIEIPTYVSAHSWNTNGGNQRYDGSDSEFNNATADETIRQNLIELGFSDSDASILAIGGSFIGHNGYKYIRFRDYVEEPFICDIKMDGVPCEIYKYKFVGAEQILPLDVIRSRYASIQKVPPLSLRIEKKTTETNFKDLGKHVYIPTHMAENNSTFNWGKTSQLKNIKDELLALGLSEDCAETISRGALITAEINAGVLSMRASFCPKNISSGATVENVGGDKKTVLTINNNQYIFCLCIGDYNYLKELDKA